MDSPQSSKTLDLKPEELQGKGLINLLYKAVVIGEFQVVNQMDNWFARVSRGEVFNRPKRLS